MSIPTKRWGHGLTIVWPSVVVSVLLAGLAVGHPSPAAGAGQAVVQAAGAGCGWLEPVEGAVIDPFRPPSHRYGPGNRGLEYDAPVGAPVSAVAAGQVGFRGPVGGKQYVVIEHGDGLRSTYGPLERIHVLRGHRIQAGDVLGQAGAEFHLTARVGDKYVDPEPLLSGWCGPPRLVPVSSNPPR